MDVIEERINSIADADAAEGALISKEIKEINRFSVSNQLRTGFFGHDACVQTDESELPNVMVLAGNTAELMKEMEVLKKDTEKKLRLINAQYESKLQEESDALYTSMNEKIISLENCYKEKLSILRRSYQQQLSDAIQVIRSSYKNGNGNTEEVDSATDERVKDLLKELQEKNLRIECMTDQLKKYEMDSEGAEDPEKNRLRSENEKLKDNIDSLHVELEEIRQTLEAKEQALALDLALVKLEAEDSKKALQKLTDVHEQVKMQLNIERESGQRQIKLLKEEMQKEIEASHIKECQEAATERNFEEQKPTEPAIMEITGNTELVQKIKELRKAEEVQKMEMERLKKQLCMSDQVWEKKFEILRQSFHAIKDEMFLRQSLQRREAVLHNASVSYAMDAPRGPVQKSVAEGTYKRLCYTSVTPLPRIGAAGQRRKDRITGTMDLSLLSKREAGSLPGLDSQLVLADEEHEV